MADTRLESALRSRLSLGGKAFVPYVTAGLEGVDAGLLRDIEEAGADALEVGVPFSDPVMDGGVIQEASKRALEGGFHVSDAFALVKEAGLSIPVVLMTYLNPIIAHGQSDFLNDSIESGVSGFIVPDLPVDEGEDWTAKCAEEGLASIYLAAPGTDQSRLEKVAGSSSGFVYCVSTYGVTGQREALSETSGELVAALRPLTDRPLLVGVGISTPDQAKQAASFSDGVIVGSALVRRLVEGDRRGALDAARGFRAVL